MRVSAQLALWLSAVFALLCFGYASYGFLSLGSEPDAATRELSLGYAWFWTFLGAVASVFGWLSWLIARGKLGAGSE